MSMYPHKRHVTKYMQTEVSKRVDDRWAAYMVLTWADLDLVSPEETFAAIHLDQPFRNPLKWVIVGTSPTKEGAVALAVSKKREIQSRIGSELNSVDKQLEEELSSLTGLTTMDGGFGLATAPT